MSLVLQVFYILFSGALFALAIPNEMFLLGSPVLGLISLVPLYLVLSTVKTYKRAFWLLFLHGCFTHLLSSFWLGNFQDFAVFTLGASDLGTGFFEGLLGLLVYMPLRFTSRNIELRESAGRITFMPAVRIITFAAAWTYWEYTKSTGFLGYPWGTLSMTAFKWPLITQSAALAGPYAVTFLFALFAALTSEGILISRRYQAKDNQLKPLVNWIGMLKFTSVLFILATLYGIVEYTQTRYPEKKMNTVLVQMNLDPWEKGEIDAIRTSQLLTENAVIERVPQG